MGTQNDWPGPARPMTLDLAYGGAYGALRGRIAGIAEAEPDMIRRNRLHSALDEIAAELQDALQDLGYGVRITSELSRPES